MYLTDDQRLELSRKSWEQALAVLEKLGKQIERLECKAEKVSGMEYAILVGEIEVVRVQYAALLIETNTRWESFQSMIESLNQI